VHPLMMGLEEHLIGMFREDFEFHAEAAPSHLGGAAQPRPEPVAEVALAEVAVAVAEPGGWTAEAERELKKIPFFVRGKARRNTEAYAAERGITTISLETLYDAKAHYAR